jgi:hypothetical protein
MKPLPPIVLAATVLLALAGPPAAATRAAKARGDDGHALHGGARSVQELVQQFLRALEAKDHNALRELRVTENEYRQVILPGSVNPGEAPRQLSPDWVDFAWGSLNTKSYYKERDLVAALGGKVLTLRETAFDGGERQYAGYKAFRHPRLQLLDNGGHELSLEMGSIAEVDDRYKFITFMRE